MALVQKGLAYATDARLAVHYERHMVESCQYRTPGVVASVVAELLEGASAEGPAGGALGHAPICLDVGAGTGLVGKAIRHAGLRVDLVALDVSPAMLELIDDPCYLSRRSADAAEVLPFGDATFDGVLAAGLLEHLPDPESLFREAARVLKPRGIFVLTFPPSDTDRSGPFELDDGLVSHDPATTRECFVRSGFSAVREIEFPAYSSGSRGWVTHHLLAGRAGVGSADRPLHSEEC